jgi:glycine cleavage system regulatory protein
LLSTLKAHTYRGLDADMMAQPTVVIVVDDNAGVLKSVARLLAHHGIDSRTFASAEALLESDSGADGNLPAARHPPRGNFGN